MPSACASQACSHSVLPLAEQAARHEDSEIGSSAERFNQQSARAKAEPLKATSDDTLLNQEKPCELAASSQQPSNGILAGNRTVNWRENRE